jgi:hypothetical protein
MGDFGTGRTWFQQADPIFMGGDIRIPYGQGCIINFADKQSAFQCGVVS